MTERSFIAFLENAALAASAFVTPLNYLQTIFGQSLGPVAKGDILYPNCSVR